MALRLHRARRAPHVFPVLAGRQMNAALGENAPSWLCLTVAKKKNVNAFIAADEMQERKNTRIPPKLEGWMPIKAYSEIMGIDITMLNKWAYRGKIQSIKHKGYRYVPDIALREASLEAARRMCEIAEPAMREEA